MRPANSLRSSNILNRIGQDVVGIEIDKLYAVYAVVPHAMHLLPNFPPFLDSIGIGENGGYAEYLVVDASQLIPVVCLTLRLITHAILI